MTRLFIVRHAQAEGNVDRIFHGWTDGGITEIGHRQAEKVAERLKNEKIDVIYSSSLKRALQTAQYIADAKSLPIIRTDKLKEINGGDWEGVPYSDLPGRWPNESYTWDNALHLHKMPNGEDIHEFQARLVAEIERIVRNNKGRNICIVTHGTAMRALLCHFHGWEIEKINDIPWCDNTAVTIVDAKDDGGYEVIEESNCTHLDDDLSTLKNQEWFLEYQKRFNNRKAGRS